MLPEQNWPVGHAVPQAPQLPESLVVFTQDEPQIVVPPAQFTPHLLAEHTWPLVQTVPQVPQFAGSVATVAHAVPHLVVPPAHRRPHLLAEHTWPVEQTVPHMPQFPASVATFTHDEPHSVVPPAQLTPHLPAEHTWPLGQTVPQVPQFAERSVAHGDTSAHALGRAASPHKRPHLPAEHTSPVQAVPQVPQLALSVATFTHNEPHSVVPPGATHAAGARQYRANLPARAARYHAFHERGWVSADRDARISALGGAARAQKAAFPSRTNLTRSAARGATAAVAGVRLEIDARRAAQCRAAHAIDAALACGAYPVGQAFAQVPQLSESLLSVTHASPHFVVPPAQIRSHLLFVHVSPAGHAVPQAPQFAPSLVSSTQRSAHSVVPPSQTRPHLPVEQSMPEAQLVPHAPQFAGSLPVFTHALPQSVVPPTQTMPHTPAEQDCPSAHALPHPPQFAGLLLHEFARVARTARRVPAFCKVGFMALNSLIYFSVWLLFFPAFHDLGGFGIADMGCGVVACGFGLAVALAGGLRDLSG